MKMSPSGALLLHCDLWPYMKSIGLIPTKLLVTESKGNIYYEYVDFNYKIIVKNYWIFLAIILSAGYRYKVS